jgi:hypothetical protein
MTRRLLSETYAQPFPQPESVFAPIPARNRHVPATGAKLLEAPQKLFIDLPVVDHPIAPPMRRQTLGLTRNPPARHRLEDLIQPRVLPGGIPATTDPLPEPKPVGTNVVRGNTSGPVLSNISTQPLQASYQSSMARPPIPTRHRIKDPITRMQTAMPCIALTARDPLAKTKPVLAYIVTRHAHMTMRYLEGFEAQQDNAEADIPCPGALGLLAGYVLAYHQEAF